jgi:internalin A
MRSNFIIQIEPGAWLCFSHLKRLYLGANELTRIPIMDGLTSLIELFLNNNHITCIEHLEPLQCLEVLDLRSNALIKVDHLDQNLQLQR